MSSEIEEKQDNKKSELYKNIYQSKFFLNAAKKSFFDIRLSRSSFDKIISLYGNELIHPLSFINFCSPVENTETIINSTKNIDMRSTMQINKILYSVNDFYIFPSSYEDLNESEKMKLCPKIKSKDISRLTKLMGIDFSDMIDYLSLQITTVKTKESYKTIRSLELYIRIFNNIHILLAKFPDKKKLQIAYYSYKKILKMSGIDLDKVFPFLEKIIIENITRDEILSMEKNILYNKVLIREIKEKIDEKIVNEKIDIYKGNEPFERMIKPEFDDLDIFRQQQSELIIKLKEKPKDEIIVSEQKEDKDKENEEIIISEDKKEDNNKDKENEEVIISEDKKEEEQSHIVNNNDENELNQNENIILEEKEEKKSDIIINEKNDDNNIKINNKEEAININLNTINGNEKNKNIEIIQINEKNESNKESEEIKKKHKESISRKLDALKVIARLNNISKKKFKIRRAVIVKVEKEK
jgi:hypothetical protein